jgi:peptidyl-prolyl cis-trans isomerase SDCCAG10
MAEPVTSGRVRLETSLGPLEVELWSREAPRACRNFVGLCLEGYYDGTLFHRVTKVSTVRRRAGSV